jgi:hypothetical protein
LPSPKRSAQKRRAHSMDMTSQKTAVACNFCRGVLYLKITEAKKISRLIRKKIQKNTYMRTRDSVSSPVVRRCGTLHVVLIVFSREK